MENEKLTLTIEEAGKLLGVSRPTAYKLAKTKQIPTITLGRRIFVPRAALNKMLEDVDYKYPASG
jgi:excisionase family DNA binding protein